MLIGIMGKMGSGKTLSMSILASFLHYATHAPLFANYHLENAQIINQKRDIWDMQDGIFCFDEIWLTLDSRLWKDNTFLTRWVNQTRKKKMIVFYTTQHIRQVELRVRNATDVLIFCERKNSGIWLSFIDWQYQTLGKKFLISKPSRFYSLYDTYEVLQPIK